MIVVDYVGDYEPLHGSKEAGGYDLQAKIPGGSILLRPGDMEDISLGIHAQPPAGYIGLLLVRSGVSKRGLRLSTCVSAIDADYTGDIIACIKNTSENYLTIRDGERLVQIIYVKCEEVRWNRVDRLQETERGSGGFGSTGVK